MIMGRPPFAITRNFWSINYNNLHKTLPAYDFVIVGSGNGAAVLARFAAY